MSAATVDGAPPADVVTRQAALAEMGRSYSQARRHDWPTDQLVLDVDLSPLPASRHAAGATRGSMGRCRSKRGRKVVRVQAAQDQETVWETVVPGRTAESLAVLQDALTQAERVLGLEGEDEAAQAKRGRVEICLDRGWGSEPIITWLRARG